MQERIHVLVNLMKRLCDRDCSKPQNNIVIETIIIKLNTFIIQTEMAWISCIMLPVLALMMVFDWIKEFFYFKPAIVEVPVKKRKKS